MTDKKVTDLNQNCKDNEDSLFEDMPIISRYTRAQAIEDRLLIDVSSTAKECGFNFPVAVTLSVFVDYIQWHDEDTERQGHQDMDARLWDVLFLAHFAASSHPNDSTVWYKLDVIPRNGRTEIAQTITLKMVLSMDDAGMPCLTIMLPDED